GLDDTAQERLASVQAHVDKHLPLALDKFYDKVRSVPAVSQFFDGRGQMDRAQSKQVGHWKAIAGGHFDADYLDASTRVGLRHAKIGLEPRWHIGGYGVIFETLVQGIVHDAMAEALEPRKGKFGRKIAASPDQIMASADAMSAALAQVLKSMLLDIDIGISAYFSKLTSEAKAADDAVRAKTDRAVGLTGAM